MRLLVCVALLFLVGCAGYRTTVCFETSYRGIPLKVSTNFK